MKNTDPMKIIKQVIILRNRTLIKNIAHTNKNSPSILNMTSNRKNKYNSNSDTWDSGCLLHSEMFSESDSERLLPNSAW